MAYYPKQRNVSGVFFHGNAGVDQVLETSSSLTYSTGTDTLTVGNLDGNATTATTALDASGLTSNVTVQISDEMTGSATFQDAGDTANVSVTAASTLISNRTEATSGNNTDYVLLLSGSELRKITKGNFVSDLGGGTMSSWDISAENGAAQTVTNAEQVDFSGAGNITITQDESSSPYRVVISGNDQVNTYTAGSGLNEDPSNTFNVQTDNSTLEVSTDIVRVKNAGITPTQIATSVAGNGLTGGAGSALAVGAGSLIDVTATTVDVDLTEAAAATIADNDELIFLDGGTTASKGSTRDLATLMAGAGLTATNSTLSLTNSGVTVQGDSGSTTLDLGETLDIGGGSGISTTVSAGSPEQVTVDLTVTSVTAGSYGSSTAVGTFTVDANGRLTAASNTNIDGSSISNNTITFSANAGSDQAVSLGQTLEISGGAATNTTMSATNIATIDVKYDNQTIGLSSDQLIVKDSGVTEAKRQRTVDSSFSNGEVISSDINLVNANAGSILLNLPAPPVSAGRLLYIKKTDSSSNTVTIDQNSSETIDGGTQYLLYNQYEAVTLICDGTNWHVF